MLLYKQVTPAGRRHRAGAGGFPNAIHQNHLRFTRTHCEEDLVTLALRHALPHSRTGLGKVTLRHREDEVFSAGSGRSVLASTLQRTSLVLL